MRTTHRLGWGLLAALLLAGCGSWGTNWKALYSTKLGQPVEEINTAALNAAYQDGYGNLTRVAWAKLQNGSVVFLGLPPHDNPTATVVERTVVLTQNEWEAHCRAAFPDRDVRGMGAPAEDIAYGNTLVIMPGFAVAAGEGSGTSFSQDGDYCEFAFLPNGWELRVVHNEGVIKTDVPGVQTN